MFKSFFYFKQIRLAIDSYESFTLLFCGAGFLGLRAAPEICHGVLELIEAACENIEIV